ncbi:MAG: FMN-binding protein [Ruminococcaceae bacterium]|nr:FMN-binding protein [Oscillospiraceae bacterium]
MNSNVKYFVRIAGMLFLICALTALIIAGVNALTKDAIDANNKAKLDSTIEDIFEKGVNTTLLDIKAEDGVTEVFEVKSGDKLVGYAVHVLPVGFKGEIEMMVGYNTDLICKSVRIINQSETPGLGSKVTGDDFLSQFEKNGEFTPIAGATVSSKAVYSGVLAATKTLEGGIEK